MRLLFWSNSPHVNTGYGIQTREITTRLRAMGHEIAVAANYGVMGAALNWNGITIYPAHEKAIDAKLTGFYVRHFGADMIISLYDIWALPLDTRAELGCPWAALLPIDSSPVSEKSLMRIRTVDWPIAFSQFGQDELADVGITSNYIPHGIDCNTFYPGDKAEARQRLGIARDVYLVTMVAANKGFPSRKSWPEALSGFAQFHTRHPNVRLYLHTTAEPVGSRGEGIYLRPLVEELGIANAVIFANETALAVGVPNEQVADIYRASDVLLNPAMGEGFGLPVVEAQACGCPVITHACSAMSELTVNGLAIEPLQPYWIPQLNVWWQLASVERIGVALERMYASRGDEIRRSNNGVDSIQSRYDWPVVMERYWRPFLDKVEATLEFQRGHQHRWAPIGYYHENVLHTPCLDMQCHAAVHSQMHRRSFVTLTGFDGCVDGIPLNIEDNSDGGVAKIITKEITGTYCLDRIDFAPGDVAVDIGAHVGVVSIYLALRYPDIRIVAVEPIPENLTLLRHNLKVNGVEDRVMVVPKAITSDGRDVVLCGDLSFNSGGSSLVEKGGEATKWTVSSLTLEDLFTEYGITRCKVLKIDCEGAEYEVLRASEQLLDQVDYLVGEFHDVEGQDPIALLDLCKQHVANISVGLQGRITGGLNGRKTGEKCETKGRRRGGTATI